MERLAAIAGLDHDWDGGGARPADRDAISLAQLLIDQFVSNGAHAPAVLPIPDGGVQLEWAAGPVEIEFEIEPGGHTAVFVCDDAMADQSFDGELPGDERLLAVAFARYIAYQRP